MALSDWQQDTIRFVLQRGGRIDEDDIEEIIEKVDGLYWFAVSQKRMRDCPHPDTVAGDVCATCGTWKPYPDGVRPGFTAPGVPCSHPVYSYRRGQKVCSYCDLDITHINMDDGL